MPPVFSDHKIADRMAEIVEPIQGFMREIASSFHTRGRSRSIYQLDVQKAKNVFSQSAVLFEKPIRRASVPQKMGEDIPKSIRDVLQEDEPVRSNRTRSHEDAGRKEKVRVQFGGAAPREVVARAAAATKAVLDQKNAEVEAHKIQSGALAQNLQEQAQLSTN